MVCVRTSVLYMSVCMCCAQDSIPITMQVYCIRVCVCCTCVCVCVRCVCVCCVCDEYGIQAIYITMQVCTFMHSMCFGKTVRNKNPKSLQVVQAQSVYVCVRVCARAQVCTFVHMRNKNPTLKMI